MKILFVAHEDGVNGASLSMLGMIDNFVENNKIYVLTNYKEGKFIDELKKRDVNIIYAPYRRWVAYKPKGKIKWIIKRILCFLACQINYVSALRVRSIIKNEKIDLIHSNTSVMNIGAILSRLCNIPHVWHIREFGQEDFNFHYLYTAKYSLNYIKKNSNGIITVSKALYSKYKNKLNTNKITVIYNGINTKNIQEKKFDKDKENINIIICGAITETKGQKDAILALNEIIKRGYHNVTLSIAGSGDTEPINDLISKLDLDTNVKLLGRVDNLVDIRKNIDLELVCSKCEAFGRVTIEAMMSMIPVIGSNTGGTTELIRDGYNGFLYKQGDYIDLADKIEFFLNNRDKIEYMGRNAYDFSKVFTSELNAKKVYDVYKEVVLT